MNNKYKITATTPLLRPGLLVSTEVSARYLVRGLKRLLESVREFNAEEPKPSAQEKSPDA